MPTRAAARAAASGAAGPIGGSLMPRSYGRPRCGAGRDRRAGSGPWRSVRYRAVSRFYITTPIYYVNDAPHVGHAYTTVNADALARWHRLIGDEVFFLTGTDEHGQKVARAAEEQGLTPERVDRPAGPPVRRGVGRPRHRQRRLHPDHRTPPRAGPSRSSWPGSTTTATSCKDTYRGLYCVSCEQYYGEDELIDGSLCPIHRTPVEHLEEENYFFRLSAFEHRLIDWYEANPGAVRPRVQAQRGPQLHQGRAPGHLHHPDLHRLGGGGARGTRSTSSTSGTTRSINYLTAIGYGEDDERFEAWWPAVHHLIGKEIIRFHCVWWPAMCMAAGIEPPAHVQVHGWLLVGGEKMSKSSLNQITPGELTADYGVDPVRYHLLRDTPLGLGRGLLGRGHHQPATTPTWPTTWATCCPG